MRHTWMRLGRRPRAATEPVFHHHQALRFRCTGCGRCCFGDADSYVEVSAREAEAIRRHLRLSRAWFRRRYVQGIETGSGLGIRLQADGRCPFLTAQLHCRVYPVRPRQCRSYPFWPEVLASRGAWNAEARRCEGIGQGAVVPLGRIEAQLRGDPPEVNDA